jgi:hypothetical protein
LPSFHPATVTHGGYRAHVNQTERYTGETYLYRSSKSSRGLRPLISAYLVERIDGSVIARIEPLGPLKKKSDERGSGWVGRHRDLVPSGPWLDTPSRRHARVRVTVTVTWTAD